VALSTSPDCDARLTPYFDSLATLNNTFCPERPKTTSCPGHDLLGSVGSQGSFVGSQQKCANWDDSRSESSALSCSIAKASSTISSESIDLRQEMDFNKGKRCMIRLGLLRSVLTLERLKCLTILP